MIQAIIQIANMMAFTVQKVLAVMGPAYVKWEGIDVILWGWVASILLTTVLILRPWKKFFDSNMNFTPKGTVSLILGGFWFLLSVVWFIELAEFLKAYASPEAYAAMKLLGKM